MPNVRIGRHSLQVPGQPYIIAEIGVNHDGDESKARRLIDSARDACADAVKFQYFTADRLMSSAARLAEYQRSAGAVDPLSMLRNLELPAETLVRLIHHAHDCGVDPIVTFFSTEHVSQLGHFPWAAVKIASPDIINKPLIQSVCDLGKPVILSTGAATIDEVAEAITWLSTTEFALLQCVSSYPTPHDAAQLAAIRVLRDEFGVLVGYSDHTTDICTGGLAVAAGACLLEKHLTHDRQAKGPDHAASLDAADFRRYVEFARLAARMRGRNEKVVQVIERNVRAVSRQSLVAVRCMKAGETISRADVTVKRPGDGLPPKMLQQVVGQILAADIEADAHFTPSHLIAQATINRSMKTSLSAASAA